MKDQKVYSNAIESIAPMKCKDSRHLESNDSHIKLPHGTIPISFVNKCGQIGLELNDRQLDLFIRYEDQLKAYSYLGLTAILDKDEVFSKHFLDSLSIFALGLELGGLNILDIGAGGGFPSLPMKIVDDDLKVTLIDSVGKKVHFLSDLIQELGFHECEAVHARVEDLAHDDLYRDRFDIVVARAVKELRILLEYSVPFLKVSGKAYFWKTKKQLEELASAQKAVKELNVKIRILDLPYLGEGERILIEATKLAPNAKKYPRSPLKIKNAPL